jgi:hypothetical protein
MNKDRRRIDFRDVFHLAAGKAIKLMAPIASSVSIGSGSGRCGAGLIRRTNRMIAQAWSTASAFCIGADRKKP